MIDFNSDIEACLNVLQRGGLILYPTDTVWGLGCDATNENAVKKLLALKQRESDTGLIILLPTERDVLQYVAAPDMEVFNYLQQVTKPTTVVYEHGLEVADNVLNADGSIAIRIVKEDFCRHLLKRFRKPVVSTSANVHGSPAPRNFDEIDMQIKNNVEYVVHYRRNDVNLYEASSMIRWINGKMEVIRS